MRTCYVAFDTETYRIVPGRLAPTPVVLTFTTSNGTEKAVTPDEGARLLRAWCEDASTIIIGHNVAFDMGVMVAAYPDLVEPVFAAYAAGRVRDTVLREKLIRLASGEMSSDFGAGSKMTSFSMEAVFKVRFNEDLSALKTGDDAWRINYHRLAGVPLEQWPKDAIDYAMGDATRTMRLFLAQGKDDSLVVDVATGAVTNEQEQVAAAWGLHLAGVWGLRTDPHAVAALARRLDEEALAHEAAMRAAGVLRANGSKDLTRIKGLVEECLGDNAPRTEKGAISTDRECLMRTGHPALKAVAELGAIDKLRKTYVPVLLQGTEVPINPSWNTLVESGRTSCRGPNLQNLPRKGGVRECFIPRKGRIFASADYSTLELCTLAQVCLDLFGHSAMFEALHAGRDLHLQMAASILGVDYDEVLRRHKAKDPQVKEMRQLAKAANFGYPGGLGAASFQTYAAATYNVTVTEDESRQLKSQWLEAWPEMRTFFDHVGRQLQMRDAFDLVQPRSGRIRGQVGYCDGCNSHFQGLAADGAKAALFFIQQECYTGKSEIWRDGYSASPLHGCRMVAFIHDEFVLEVPEDLSLAQAAVARLVDVMVEGMALYVPDVPIKAEPTLMRRWYKEAEPVWDADGKLLVWEPKEKA